MEKNLFEEVEFGNKFLTRDGRLASYIGTYDINNESLIELITEDRILITVSKNSGFVDFENNISQNDDIVSRFHESININKLKELAKQTQQYDIDDNHVLYKSSNGIYTPEDLDIIFIAGYLARANKE